MALIENDDMIKQVATAIDNKSFCDAILPGTPNCSADRFTVVAMITFTSPGGAAPLPVSGPPS